MSFRIDKNDFQGNGFASFPPATTSFNALLQFAEELQSRPPHASHAKLNVHTASRISPNSSLKNIEPQILTSMNDGTYLATALNTGSITKLIHERMNEMQKPDIIFLIGDTLVTSRAVQKDIPIPPQPEDFHGPMPKGEAVPPAPPVSIRIVNGKGQEMTLDIRETIVLSEEQFEVFVNTVASKIKNDASSAKTEQKGTEAEGQFKPAERPTKQGGLASETLSRKQQEAKDELDRQQELATRKETLKQMADAEEAKEKQISKKHEDIEAKQVETKAHITKSK